jgi:YfiH family protein
VADRLAALGVPHAFTTRLGGGSAPPFDTLNLGRGVGDAPEAVRANRAAVLRALGRSLEDQVEATQVHGCEAAVAGSTQRGQTISGVDILITCAPSVVLAIHSAVCVPILVFDPIRRAAAAVHTGWRGTAAGAAWAAVAALVKRCGSRASDLVAAVGPAIGPCCYEVDRPVFERFASWPWRAAVFAPERGDRWRLDLWDANVRQLTDAGLPAAAISLAGLCTACHPDAFFSHRRDGPTGRMVAHIALPSLSYAWPCATCAPPHAGGIGYPSPK